MAGLTTFCKPMSTTDMGANSIFSNRFAAGSTICVCLLAGHNILCMMTGSRQTDESRALPLGFRNSGGSAKPWMGVRNGICNRGIIAIPRSRSSAPVLQ